jgi:hypothetical protein
MSNREQRGFAHLEIIQFAREIDAKVGCRKTIIALPCAPLFFCTMIAPSELLFPELNRGNFSDLDEVASGFQ